MHAFTRQAVTVNIIASNTTQQQHRRLHIAGGGGPGGACPRLETQGDHSRESPAIDYESYRLSSSDVDGSDHHSPTHLHTALTLLQHPSSSELATETVLVALATAGEAYSNIDFSASCDDCRCDALSSAPRPS